MATKMSDPRELLLHELGDILYAEKLLVKTLPKLQKEASDEELSTRFGRHTEETKQQVQNLEQAFKALGEKAKAEKCPGIEGIKAEHDEFVSQESPSPDVLNAFLTGAAARTEHYEIAAYEGAITMAKAMGETEVARLLDENLRQEKENLKRVNTIAKRLAKEQRSTAPQGSKTTQQSRSAQRSNSSGGGRGGSGKMNPIRVQKHLKGMSYPATKDELVSTAQKNGADEGLLEQLRSTGRNEFTGPDDVMEALGNST